VDAIVEKFGEVKYRLSNLLAAGEEAWETMRDRLEETMGDLKEEIRRTRR
jgi:hypothetical protein